MVSCRSDVAGEIRQCLTMRQVAEHYGFEPNRSGYICCPFHNEKTASLKIYPGSGGWHCFGCGKGGSVIDFVMQLFQIPFPQAVVRLSSDFGLGLTTRRPTKREASRILEEKERREREKEEEREQSRELDAEYRYWFEASKIFAPDPKYPHYFHPLYVEAVKRLPYLDYLIDGR